MRLIRRHATPQSWPRCRSGLPSNDAPAVWYARAPCVRAEEDAGRAMGAVSEVGEEPVQPMAERRVWWCGGWPHCEKAARMVGWAPAHAQAGFERAEGGLGEGKCCIALCMSGPASGQVAHQSRKNSSPKDRETCDCRASRTDSELMLLAPAPRLPFFLAWLPSGAVVVSKSARPGVKGKKGQGVRGS